MRARALPSFLLLGLLAGCLSPPAEVPLPGDAPVLPLDLAWGLTGCKAAVIAFSVPASAVAPHLPPGFRPMGIPEGAFGVSGTPSDGSFGMEMMECQSGTGLAGEVKGISYGSYFAFVEPPAELSRSNVTYQFYKWDVLVPDAARRDLLAERGVPARNGTASFSRFDRVGQAIAFDGLLQLGNATHRFQGTAAAPDAPTGSFVEFTKVPRGVAVWSANYTWSEIVVGPALVDAGGAGLAAKILGPGQHAGGGFVGVINFGPASIALP
ncbi:MAG TPA: hypothetical protein VHI93_01200 [Candidatus Thermoplasmatota archaeon]|nr:hypothetical protein [Candidatus Thermoplasmatota archaeon]